MRYYIGMRHATKKGTRKMVNRKMITIRIDPGLHKKLKSVCSFLGVKMQDVITDMVTQYVETNLEAMAKWAKEVRRGK